ncbi:MAG: hypothetical protein ACI94Y_000498 [Maribacter sp.]|jgi:hypothetical protein
MKNLPKTKASLKKLLIKGIPPVLSELKGLLPSDSAKANDVLLLEGRLNAENKKLLRGTISNEQLQLAYNQIRSDLMDLIDSIEEKDFTVQKGSKKDKKGIQKGELLYRIPGEMQLQEETKCIVRIALDDEEIIKNIELDEHVALKELSRVSNLMQVSLMDPSENAPFSIRTISEPEQLIFEDGYTEWTFFVKPLKEGKFPLVIKVAVIELVFNKERKREIVFEEKINVSTQASSDDELKAPFKKSKDSFILGVKEAESKKKPSSLFKIQRVLGMVLLLAVSVFGMRIAMNFGDKGIGKNEFAYAEAKSSPKYDYVEETIHKSMGSVDIENTTSRVVGEEEYSTMTRAASMQTTSIPAVSSTITERVIVEQKRILYRCIPPAFIFRERRILVEERLRKEGRVKPQFKKSVTKVEIKPRVTVYECVTPESTIKKISYEKVGEIIRKKSIPAKFETKIDTITQGYSKTYIKAATYEQIEKEIEIAPSVTKRILVKKANCNDPDIQKCMDWKEQVIPAKIEKVSGWKFVSCPDGYNYDGKSCVLIREIPPTTVSSQVLMESARIEEEIIPAKIATYDTKIYQDEKRPKKKVIPAKFKKIEIKLIQNKKDYSSDNIEKIYKTVKVKVLRTKADYVEETIPARFMSITKRIERSPMKIVEKGTIPATYKTVIKEIVVEEKAIIQVKQPTDSIKIKIKKIVDTGGNRITVRALKSPSERIIKEIQNVLKREGFYDGVITKKLNAETLTALSLYQNENSLPIGVLDEETLMKMGVIE